jgi:hypothetical protein
MAAERGDATGSLVNISLTWNYIGGMLFFTLKLKEVKIFIFVYTNLPSSLIEPVTF